MAGYIGMHYDLWLYIDEGLAAWPLYTLGFAAYPYIKKIYSSTVERDKKVRIGTIVLSIVFFVTLFLGLFVYTIVPLGNYSRPNYFIALGAMVMCFPCVLWIANLLHEKKFLKCLGRRTLGIMLVHAPMCHTAAVILNRVFEKGSMLWIASFLIAYVLIVVVAYGLTCLLERYVPILFGKKRVDRLM